jgi:transposase, IS6 family
VAGAASADHVGTELKARRRRRFPSTFPPPDARLRETGRNRWGRRGTAEAVHVTSDIRDHAAAARRCFERALGATKITPVEVITDQAATYPVVLEELLPAAWHRSDRYAKNGVEGDHGRLKARLGPMRGLRQDRSARVVIAGHGFVQNLRRGHYELAVEEPVNQRMAVAFDELALAI